ncbi:MAG: type VI secretion system tube protein Hcp [Verrucomicrobia bacterium]|nr:type VI secretion system tube protein Hcp [Verrucomicrobiota bacterium]MDA1069012.1 type VI secretion system tube protein Hcp [Verrucomicrobiota bacterium]
MDAQRTRGDTTLGDVVVTRQLDKATPKLFEACGNGTFFPEVVLTLQKQVGSGEQVDYLKITMTDVIITSVSTGGSGGEDRLTENVSLNFTEADVVYTVYQDNGTSTGIVSGTVQQSVGTP